jgi:hypothetical protein
MSSAPPARTPILIHYFGTLLLSQETRTHFR